MIILIADEADKVRGRSINKWAALVPIPLKDGTFALPEAVLSDPSHTAHSYFLKTLPRRDVYFGKPGATKSDPIDSGEVVADPEVLNLNGLKQDWQPGVPICQPPDDGFFRKIRSG